MSESKVKSLKAVVYNGTHKTWTNPQGKTFYCFDIELEDGQKGSCLGQKPTGPAYTVGDTVTYQLVDGKIKDIKKMMSNGSEYKSHYDDPVVQRKITVNVCMKLAVQMCKGKPNPVKGDFLKVTNGYIDFIYKEGNDPQTLLDRRSALERAHEASELPEEPIAGTREMFKFAEEILEWTRSKLPK